MQISYQHQQRNLHPRIGRVDQNYSFSQERDISDIFQKQLIRTNWGTAVSSYSSEQKDQYKSSHLPQIDKQKKASGNPKIRIIEQKKITQIHTNQQNQYKTDKQENQMQNQTNGQQQQKYHYHIRSIQAENIEKQNMQSNNHQNNSKNKINNLQIDQQSNRSTESLLKTTSGVCIQCQLRISSNYINLKCQHQYHTCCLKEFLQNQVRQQNFRNFHCYCGKHHIPYLLQLSLNIQCLIIKKSYQSFILICGNCKVFFIINNSQISMKQSSYCQNCDKQCLFEQFQ